LTNTECIASDIIPIRLKDLIYGDFQTWFQEYLQFFIYLSEKIICNSEFTKVELLDYFNENNLKNIPECNAVLLPYQYRSSSIPRPIPIPSQSLPINIFVPGTIEVRKQQGLVFDLFIEFIKKYPSVPVTMTTMGRKMDMKCDMQDIVKRSQNKIKYLNICTNDELKELYQKATFTVFVSFYEGFGLPISESLWYGTPVLCANFGSMNEVAQVGGCYTIDTKNKEEIASALEKLILYPEIVKKLASEINYDKMTTWKDYSNQIFKSIESLF
jgi:glycosyltransferase involved in cell wall biosynthesis